MHHYWRLYFIRFSIFLLCTKWSWIITVGFKFTTTLLLMYSMKMTQQRNTKMSSTNCTESIFFYCNSYRFCPKKLPLMRQRECCVTWYNTDLTLSNKLFMQIKCFLLSDCHLLEWNSQGSLTGPIYFFILCNFLPLLIKWCWL